jgi:hypothetical protein
VGLWRKGWFKLFGLREGHADPCGLTNKGMATREMANRGINTKTPDGVDSFSDDQ